MSRLTKLAVETWDPELRDMAQADSATELERGITRMLAHAPEMAKGALGFGAAVTLNRTLPERLIELVCAWPFTTSAAAAWRSVMPALPTPLTRTSSALFTAGGLTWRRRKRPPSTLRNALQRITCLSPSSVSIRCVNISTSPRSSNCSCTVRCMWASGCCSGYDRRAAGRLSRAIWGKGQSADKPIAVRTGVISAAAVICRIRVALRFCPARMNKVSRRL